MPPYPGGSTPTAEAQSPEGLGPAAIKLISERQKVPADQLVVVSAALGRYPLQGKTAFAYKILGPAGALYGVTLDPSGREVDQKQLVDGELAAFAAKYGKLDP